MNASIDSRLLDLKKRYGQGVWASRALAQLHYLRELSRFRDGAFDEQVVTALSALEQAAATDGVIGRSTALAMESSLSTLGAEAKKYTIICAGHAHIDMNWMWGWHETVAVTLDTFQTVLDLMEEYPDFHFSQSQAAIYRLVEKYAPAMFEAIQQRVKEGRWEVTASTWVEFDKNMSGGESFARHHLYTKRYLADRFDSSPDDFNLDFEPDTFGHHANLPELLADGGIAYYYHCRGADDHEIYRWEAPSGRSVLVYREPEWYNGLIVPDMALYVPKFCHTHGVSKMLSVYGVGNHGGGPTRLDIERIQQMNEWPLYPNLRFGRIGDFFAYVAQAASDLPLVKGERNFVFTGCYTSQSRIKMANRTAERSLRDAEAFASIAHTQFGSRYPTTLFEDAWRKVLFNQFHDILPGSGVVETREHAMGTFQESMAVALSQKRAALRTIAGRIDTTKWLPEKAPADTAQGAGGGFGTERYRLSQPALSGGHVRVFHVFNALEYDRREVVEITVWDWDGDPRRIRVHDADGNPVRYQVIGSGKDHYWGHHYLKVLCDVTVPALGYSTYLVSEEKEYDLILEAPVVFPPQPRVERPTSFVMENDHLIVQLDPDSFRIVSIRDKKTNEECAGATRDGGFRFITEDDREGMTSWRVGRYMEIVDLHRGPVKLIRSSLNPNALRQWVTYEIAFRQSKLTVTVSLDQGSHHVQLDVTCDWHEKGRAGQGVPQLNFQLPVAYRAADYRYDIPFGVVQRPALDMDVPAGSWALAYRDTGPAVMLWSDSKYGFRGTSDSLAVSILRGSYDPDPYPEVGVSHCRLMIALVDPGTNREPLQRAAAANHPMDVVSAKRQAGDLPPSHSFMRVTEGAAQLSAVKLAEAGDGVIVRLYETEGKAGEAVLECAQALRRVQAVDINERPSGSGEAVLIDEHTVRVALRPFGVTTLLLSFDQVHGSE